MSKKQILYPPVLLGQASFTNVASNGTQVATLNFLNDTLLLPLAVIDVTWQFSTAPTAGTTVGVHLQYSTDGVNYDSVVGGHSLVAQFAVTNSTSTFSRIIGQGVPLMPFRFRVAASNNTDQTLTSLTVKIFGYSTGLC